MCLNMAVFLGKLCLDVTVFISQLYNAVLAKRFNLNGCRTLLVR
ncbi:MAG: hypothetical protein NT023_03715 [Armatimonadetes bacterium]|nr:hypothetical protein [Armatimonadota bacterium]